MKVLLKLEDLSNAGKKEVGGKAYSLSKVQQSGFCIPETFCVPCKVFEQYLSQTGLKDRILLELNRKSLEKMRWEELWDISLRIRNYFLTTPMPAPLLKALETSIVTSCSNYPVAVRSSAPGEDSSENSFAGLHASFLNISGTDEILKHIRLVWASLYSDAALLYRKELGLDIHKSQMAVIIQELIPSDKSGIFFGINPSNANESVIESVYGLNQALVDGNIEPDRWILNRSSGNIIDHTAPVRNRAAKPTGTGITFENLENHSAQTPPLNSKEIQTIRETGRQLETLFNRPQDMEWTFFNDRLTILQARPITSTGFTETDDKRSWYLTLHRSYDNLKELYQKIEHHLIPQMIAEAKKLGELNLDILSIQSLCAEIEKRQAIYDEWVKIYWAEFIPFAHGIRLFGQVYNDVMTPEDPYEFMGLLEKTKLKSVERNTLLEKLAGMIHEDKVLQNQLAADLIPETGHPFRELLDSFIDQFGDLSCSTGSGSECQYGEQAMIPLLLEFSNRPAKPVKKNHKNRADLTERYLQSFPPDRQNFAKDLLFLGRESYRLRDDDNIHLGRIEARLLDAVQEGQKRLENPSTPQSEKELLLKIPALSLVTDNDDAADKPAKDKTADERWVSSRQIVGHPAGPGIASGKARLIRHPRDLLLFKQGEILVCQGVDPNMTFVIPLAAGVVEERGGMLIHGAIIAREYGLPCITGAANVMHWIKNGDQITVDGYLGIVTCKTKAL